MRRYQKGFIFWNKIVMWFILVYIVNSDNKEADMVISHLLEQKLIACANKFSIQSSFMWKWNLENENEVVALCKSMERNWSKIKSEVEKVHSYETPCIIKVESEANKEFEEWVDSEVL